MNPTVKEYIDQQDPERRETLKTLRTLVSENAPGINESMAYNMPTYDINGHLVFAFASQKHYLSFYVILYDMLEPFSNKLAKYNCGKSCIRFTSLDDETTELLKRIVQYTLEHLEDSAHFEKYQR